MPPSQPSNLPARLLASFPGLKKAGWHKTSEPNEHYNCIAWAAGDDTRWWWPAANNPRTYWPHPNRVRTRESFIRAFETLGYSLCDGGKIEAGYEKVAFYEDNNGWVTHAARQLNDGKWTSKLGIDFDLSHGLRALEGPEYGKVAFFMRRQIEA